MIVVVGTEVERYNDGGYDPEDSWSRDSYSGEITAVWARPAQDGETASSYSWGQSWAGELDVTKGDQVYIVAACYTTGDTFGSDGGQVQIVDVFTDPELAEGLLEVAEAAKSVTYEFNGKEYSCDWWGYFEHLDTIYVYERVVTNVRERTRTSRYR